MSDDLADCRCQFQFQSFARHAEKVQTAFPLGWLQVSSGATMNVEHFEFGVDDGAGRGILQQNPFNQIADAKSGLSFARLRRPACRHILYQR